MLWTSPVPSVNNVQDHHTPVVLEENVYVLKDTLLRTLLSVYKVCFLFLCSQYDFDIVIAIWMFIRFILVKYKHFTYRRKFYITYYVYFLSQSLLLNLHQRNIFNLPVKWYYHQSYKRINIVPKYTHVYTKIYVHFLSSIVIFQSIRQMQCFTFHWDDRFYLQLSNEL